MAHPDAPQDANTPLYRGKAILWIKRFGLIALGIVGLAIIVKLIGFPSWNFLQEKEWEPVSLLTECAPRWNERRGWCALGNFPKGTYRIIPVYDVWQMKLAPNNPPLPTDLEFLPVPPQGLNVDSYLGKNIEMKQYFLESAFIKSRNYGSIIVRTGKGGDIREVLDMRGRPREIELAEEQEIFVNVNLPAVPNYFSGNKGTLSVEVQRLKEGKGE